MSAINNALKELRYFFSMLEETKLKPNEFKSNLNAFISRGRSITWVIKKQYSNQPKFLVWYQEIEQRLREDELMRFFVNARNVSEKEQPLDPAHRTKFFNLSVAPKEKDFAITSEGEAVWIQKVPDQREKISHASEFDHLTIKEYYFVNPQPPKRYSNLQVIDLCKIYLDELSRICADADSLFAETK